MGTVPFYFPHPLLSGKFPSAYDRLEQEIGPSVLLVSGDVTLQLPVHLLGLQQ